MNKAKQINLDFLDGADLSPDYKKIRDRTANQNNQEEKQKIWHFPPEPPFLEKEKACEIKPIPNHFRYYADINGNIWGTKTGKWMILTTRIHRDGYKMVNLSEKGKKITRLVHHLVLEAFCGPRPEGTQTLHLNDVKTDNRIENLKWGTQSENMKMVKIRKKHAAPLTLNQIEEIRKLRENGNSYTEISKKARVGRHVAINLLTGKTFNSNK